MRLSLNLCDFVSTISCFFTIAPLVALPLIGFPAAASAKNEVPSGTQYFANKKGIVVKMTPSPNKGKVIAEITGTALEIDGRAVELNVDRTQKPDVFFTRNILGKTRYYLSQSPTSWEGLKVIGVEGDLGKVYFAPKMVKTVDAKKMVREALFLHDDSGAGTTPALPKALEHFKKQCGYSLKTDIPPNAPTETKDTNGYCADALAGASDLCGDDIGKKALKTGLSQFSCSLGTQESVSLKAGKLSLQFTKDSASLRDSVKELLESSL